METGTITQESTTGEANIHSPITETSPNNKERDIPVQEIKDDKDTVKVKFTDKDFIRDYVKKTTVKSTVSNEIGGERKTESVDDLRERIKGEEKQYQEQFTKADFDEIALFLIDLLDTGVSTSLRAWAKDKSDKDYQIDAIKKGKLAKQLALLLVKYKLKWSIEFVFLLSICIFYAGPVQRARKRRKTLKEITSSTTSDKSEPTITDYAKASSVKEDKKSEDESTTSNSSPKVTRKGRPFSKIK